MVIEHVRLRLPSPDQDLRPILPKTSNKKDNNNNTADAIADARAQKARLPAVPCPPSLGPGKSSGKGGLRNNNPPRLHGPSQNNTKGGGVNNGNSNDSLGLRLSMDTTHLSMPTTIAAPHNSAIMPPPPPPRALAAVSRGASGESRQGVSSPPQKGGGGRGYAGHNGAHPSSSGGGSSVSAGGSGYDPTNCSGTNRTSSDDVYEGGMLFDGLGPSSCFTSPIPPVPGPKLSSVLFSDARHYPHLMYVI